MMGLLVQYLQRLYRGAVDGWDRFWFTGIDPAGLGLIRILTGWMLVYTHLVWTLGLNRFLGPDSMLPPEYVQEFHGSSWAWSYLFWIESPLLLKITHGIALLIFLSFMVGFKTRWTGILSFLITVAYINRTVHGLFGLDQINGFLAFYLAIGPSGAAYSVDRWLKSRKSNAHLAIQKSVGANVSTRLIQLHMCIVYLFAALGKLQGETWWTGEALWGALANYEYQTIDMTWTAEYPMLIDLLEWQQPRDDSEPYANLYRPGLARLALRSSDLQADYNFLLSQGVEVLSEPATVMSSADHGSRFFCFKDPEGTFLELVQSF